MPSIPSKTPTSAYKAIPDPIGVDESLYHAVVALKEVVEVLTRQRKPLLSAAVTFQDLVDIGLVGSDGRALQPHGTNLNYLNQLLGGSTGDDVATTISGALQAANNLNDVANVTTSQQNLSLEPGVDVLAYDPQLTSNIRQVISNANLTLDLTHGEKHIYCSATGGFTWTIPANSSVAFPIGTAITFCNLSSGSANSIAITTDTMYWLPTGTTGTRTLANGGLVTVLKVASTTWVLTGVGVS